MRWWFYRLRRSSFLLWLLGNPDEPIKCDWCPYEAPLRDLNPCSGDVWLCSKCLRRYLKGE